MTPRLARSAWGSLETLHVVAFLASEVQQAYDRFGVPATRAGYFAARSSAFGTADPALVVATTSRRPPTGWRWTAGRTWGPDRIRSRG